MPLMTQIYTSARADQPQHPFLLYNSTFLGSEGPALNYRGTNVSIINNAFGQYMFEQCQLLHSFYNSPMSRDKNFAHITPLALNRTLGCGIERNGQGNWNPNDNAPNLWGKAGASTNSC